MKEELKPYKGITFMINKVVSTLEKDGVTYANIINVEDIDRHKYTMRERRGLPVYDFIAKPVECIVEIISFDFFSSETPEKNLPEDIEKGEFIWSETGYLFVPELFEMVDGHQEDDNYEYDEDEYDLIAKDYFQKWGIMGIGLDVYQDKPMVKTKKGVFLFNEYENEDIIEEWEVGQTIYFRPKEILLRGIKVFEGEWKQKEKEPKYGIELKENESYFAGKPRFVEKYG